jgi:hypothetical protein
LIQKSRLAGTEITGDQCDLYCIFSAHI